jgi:hypothetical protein
MIEGDRHPDRAIPRTLHGRSGLYLRFDQMLIRPDPRSARGLSLFGVAMTNLSGRVEESHFLELAFSRPEPSVAAMPIRSAS